MKEILKQTEEDADKEILEMKTSNEKWKEKWKEKHE